MCNYVEHEFEKNIHKPECYQSQRSQWPFFSVLVKYLFSLYLSFLLTHCHAKIATSR